MNLKVKYKNMSRNPKGLLGVIMMKRMNAFHHAALSEWAFSFADVPSQGNCLDVGCGGGANVKRLLQRTSGNATGVDYSPTAVSVSKRKNRKAIKAERCTILEADVSSLPFLDQSFDFISAFETIYFWPSLPTAFKEIRRVIKDGGTFMIVNEAAGRKEESHKSEAIIQGMKIHSPEEIKDVLLSSGFHEVDIKEDTAKDWVVIFAK